MRSKCRDQYQGDTRETNDKTKPFRTVIILPSFFVAATEEAFGARIVCCRRSDSKEPWILRREPTSTKFSQYQVVLSVILVGKRDSRRHSSTSFSKNFVVAKTSYVMKC